MRTSLVVILATAAALAACSGTGEPAGPTGAASAREGTAASPRDRRIVELGAGGFHTCVLLDDGQVECWGQCGRQCGVRPNGSTERLPVVGLADAIELAVGENHGCARLADGDVACWGSNVGGELGRLEPDDSAVPLRVPDVHDVVDIASGGDLVCARTRDGGVTCWGSAAQDHAQTPEAQRARLPQRVDGLADAQSLVVDGSSACARNGTDVWTCWGWGATPPDWIHRMQRAAPDPRLNGVVAWFHSACSCKLGIDGVVHCVGSGVMSARLADGSSPPLRLHRCPADGLADVRTLGDGCAIMNDGTVRCWGEIYFARAGAEPRYEDLTEPTAIDGIADATALALGSRHACVLTGAGALWCWGSNAQGQIDGRTDAKGVWPPRRVDVSIRSSSDSPSGR